MAAKGAFLVLLLVYLNTVESANIIDRSYEYVMSLGKSLAPNIMAFIDCIAEDDAWICVKKKAGKVLDGWDEDVKKQRRMWQDAADGEVRQSGRAFEDLPSKIGGDVESSLLALSDLVQTSIARSFSPKKHGSGIDSVTITTNDKKKKKKKPAHVHVHEKKQDQGPMQSWVIGHEKSLEEFNTSEHDKSTNFNEDSTKTHEDSTTGVSARGFLQDAWSIGEKTIDSLAEHAVESDNAENGLNDRSSADEQRGKKKKKKKAILKLLLLGAVLKAKIGTLLQILSFKLQVKFLLIALAGLLINLARFWIDVKNKHHQPPQKVIYYEHAQHQHHYDHEEEPGWGGPWSRSMEPEETEVDPAEAANVSPYRAQERMPQVFLRPAPSRI